MSSASERAKDRRSLRLEYLEERNLLSVMTPTAIAAEVQTATPRVAAITGTIQGGRATSGLYIATLPDRTSYSGHGTARPLGNALFSSQEIESFSGSTVTITSGDALLTTFKGANLYIAYTGTGQIVSRRPIAVSLNGTVTGGTGTFSGVTGTFVASGTIIPGSGKFKLTYTISNLTYPL